jgi:glycosyltransferase involved in cell wall biosynthesis
LGHEVKVLGINYGQEPHNLPFSVIPFYSFDTTLVQLKDILDGWFPDKFVVLLDMPNHGELLKGYAHSAEYIACFPIEGLPVSPKWAQEIKQADRLCVLSEFGAKALNDMGFKATSLPIAPTLSFGKAEKDMVDGLKEKVGLKDKFTVLKVADNHARKNWAHTFEFFARFPRENVVLNAVTRPKNELGWDMEELLDRHGKRLEKSWTWELPNGNQIRLVFGVTRNDLAWLYNFSRTDGCLLIDSGNEGLCMPILEAFQTCVPVIGSNHTAIKENLSDGRGLLFDAGYRYTDVFGNVDRYFPEYDSWANALETIMDDAQLRKNLVTTASNWLKTRSWLDAAKIVAGE